MSTIILSIYKCDELLVMNDSHMTSIGCIFYMIMQHENDMTIVSELINKKVMYNLINVINGDE